MTGKYSVRTAQETLRLRYKIGQLLLHREIIDVCSEIYKIRRNKMWPECRIFVWQIDGLYI